jgi:acyl transferase domain-containing protein/SAM-dependent methyltransferase
MTKDFLTRIADLSPKRLALLASEMQERIESLERASREPIAIIGMGCRTPGAPSGTEGFWQLLHGGVDAIAGAPSDRWDAAENFYRDSNAAGNAAMSWGGFLSNPYYFDAGFFGIAPREAVSMDPQQRLLLEVTWESLEDAGINADRLAGSRTGVFVGICNSDYAQLLVSRPTSEFDAYLATGSSHSVAAGRLSYVLGLQGPCIAVDTSCSSSLVAVHMACQSLRSQESSLALAAGVNLILTPQVTIALSKANMMAPDGRCKTFDDAADGFVRGEGCGVLVLKRLSDAQRDGDRILAVIRGTASNQDGRSGGLTAPNGPAQEAVLKLALANAGLGPEAVSYVEAHGTGTSLGDPIEVQALGEVLCAGRSKREPLYVGSVKTNIGHLEAAAGIAGLIKVVLSLQHREIPAHLHLKKKNTHVDWEQYAIEVPTEPMPWPARNGKRIAGVSSFGFSGTNAHVILEEGPEPKLGGLREGVAQDRAVHVFTVSAKNATALEQMVGRYREHLQGNPEQSLADIAYTANVGRAHFSHRVAIVSENRESLSKHLAEYGQTQSSPGMVKGEVFESQAPKIGFLFSGQGSQYVGMGRELYESSEVFRAAVDRCVKAVEAELERPLLEVMWGDGEKLGQTEYTQPALYALEWGLAELWKSWGIEPSVVLGHSIGEYVAAAVAGVIGVEEGMKLVAARGRLMQGLGAGGAMLSVRCSAERVQGMLKKYEGLVSLGAVNGPESVVVSGWANEIGEIEEELRKQGVVVKRLAVSHGFHSPQMEGMLDQWEHLARTANYRKPNVPLACNVTGELIEDDRLGNAQYWRRQVREPVQFMAGLRALVADGTRLFVEIGPHPILIGMGREFVLDSGTSWLASLQKGRSEWRKMLEGLAELYTRGAQVNWKEFDRGYPRRKLALPTYAFQRKKYCIEARRPTWEKVGDGSQSDRRPLQAPFADWFYEMQWQLKLHSSVKETGGSAAHSSSWLIFADKIGVADSLAGYLANRNERYTLVQQGTEFQRFSAGHFTIRPEAREDYERLFSELDQSGFGVNQSVVFLWGLDTSLRDETLDSAAMQESLIQNCIPIVNLMQQLARTPSSIRTKLWIGTSGAQALTAKSGRFALAQATAWGLGKVYALEQAETWGGLIDIDPDNSNGIEGTAANLYREILHSDGEDQVAFRSNQRFVARLLRMECPTSQALRFRSDRTYLITGGLGEIGLETARWMVESGAGCLVLVGRNVPGPGEKRLEAVRRLEESGAKIHAVSADVANFDQMKCLLARVECEMPPLGGIFHLASDAVSAWKRGERQIDSIRPEHVSAMMHAKAVGAWVIHQLTEKMNLDYFVLFSSTSSVWGSWGLAHYAAANQFLDLLAHYRHSLNLPALVVNWSSWDTARVKSAGLLYGQFGTPPMRAENALEALGRLMTSGKVQETIAEVDWDLMRSAHESRRARPLFREIGIPGVSKFHDEPQWSKESFESVDLPNITAGLRPQLNELVERTGLGSYRDLAPKVDLLCGGYIVAALQRMGCSFVPGQRWNAPDLAARLGVIPEHFRVFERMIEILVEDGVLARNRDRLEVRSDRSLVDPDTARKELLRTFPDYENELEMLERCASKLDSSLRGEGNVLHLLFPDGSLAAAEHMYQKSPANRTYNLLLTEAVVAVSKGLRDSPIRILEIGAGTGGSTSYVLPAVSGMQVEYVFTDVAQIFLNNARRKFADYSWIRYQLLNLEKEPLGQGFSAKDFDIIIAANVVHATPDLRRSLGHIRSLLTPGGIFLLLEQTKPTRVIDLTFGLTDGWWKYSDVDLRASYPLMHRSVWKRLLAEVGFTQVGIVPEGTDDDKATEQTLILGREPVVSEQARTRRGAPLISRGALPQESSPANWLESLGHLSIQERRAWLDSQIRREVAAVLNFGEDDIIREDQSFSSLGLDSLTALELKNRLQQRLGGSLPPTVAFEYPTVRAMSDFLETVLEASTNLKQEVAVSSQREELEW